MLEDRVPHCSVCGGVMKPDIVFFGEPMPERFLLHVVDFPMADLLLILGTSLQVCHGGSRLCAPAWAAGGRCADAGRLGRRQDAGSGHAVGLGGTQCARGGRRGRTRDPGGHRTDQRCGQRLGLKMAALRARQATWPSHGEGMEETGRRQAPSAGPRSWGGC